ncbi:hypothetical protein PGTUg99_037102 [Puccinia graminis f. sp. tritici]|uniref:DUF6589 domain-containing protein n=2 Tax=Puccinia graminis f. sp. tritici TaxID=56615 RepID=A0A5B0RS86_PUCGR|nr:hypothetical protein PGTUg99_037102 [Puccinia graminis f. sp. tritici]
MSQPASQNNAPRRYRTEASKITAILDLMSEMDHDPKSFMISFLRIKNDQAAIQRRYWRTPRGWDGTSAMIDAIRDFICTDQTGKAFWEERMLSEATRIVVRQKPPSGIFPEGGYYSTKKITPEFFDDDKQDMREEELTQTHTPFLFNLLYNKMTQGKKKHSVEEEDKDPNGFEQLENEDQELDTNTNSDFFREILVAPIHLDHHTRAKKTATVACSMVSFILNRRINGMQLANSLTFLASGVSDRVNHYLNYIGLASSRRTAHRSLEVLGVHAEKVIKKKMSQSEAQIMPPFLCIDNLDFEQRVHAKSLGHTSKMFHGTWGYIHHLNPMLVSSVPAGDLSLESYTASMKNAAEINVTPTMFLASKAEEQHWTSVLKCQIAKVILEYIAVPSNKDFPITSSPPVVEQISHNRPDITMLKLMIASDNSAQGVEDVCTGIIQQTNLSETQFYNRLLMLDGDLGTCVNVKCLQNQRFPSSHVENSLDNICTLLGGAHTLWNIGHAIYTKHFGNSSDSRDSGAWRYLESLGIPSRKTLDKKDFTLMIDNMIKIHEATLVHCIMLVMGKENISLDPEPQSLPSKDIVSIINSTYTRFFSAKSRVDASKRPSPKLSNLQLRLFDFASVCEANTAMKAGDIGRVMFMWKRWAVMAQGIKKLSNYAVHLPRMIVLMNEILPPGLSKVVRHSLLVAPSARQKHFVAKDLYLEMQNYSLKYFFNHSGRGTEIKRLKDVYSVNIPLVLAGFDTGTEQAIRFRECDPVTSQKNQASVSKQLLANGQTE